MSHYIILFLNEREGFTFEKMWQTHYSLIFPAKATTKNPEHDLECKHKKTLKGGEGEADQVKPSRLKEGHDVEFYFCFIFPRLGAERLKSWKY